MTEKLENADERRMSRVPAVAVGLAAVVVALATLASAILSPRPWAQQFMADRWPFVVLGISVGLVIVLITIARVPAFLALILAAMVAGFMATVGSLPGDAADVHWVRAVKLTGAGLGKTAGDIGIIIALASLIGLCLLQSGSADKIVRWFLDLFGERFAGLALLLSTYIISIPIFFDTIFMLLVPLAVAMARRTGGNYVLYIMAICAAGATTHCTIIPHPGPAAMAGHLSVDPGLSILVGLLVAIIPILLGWLLGHLINRLMTVDPAAQTGSAASLVAATVEPEQQLPPLKLALLPIILPIFLIAVGSTVLVVGADWPAALRGWPVFFGDRNVALLAGAIAAIGVLMHQRRLSLAEVATRTAPALETAGVIILITSAGGAFGAMLRAAGVGEAIKSATAGQGISPLFLAFVVAAGIRMAQGSSTVAMLTAAPMMAAMIGPDLPYHRVYIFLAIGYGALFLSWMNDSGFWVISRLGGLTEKQTLASWTILSSVLALAGLLVTWLASVLLPMKQAAGIEG